MNKKKNKIINVSSSGKLILCGEHAVLYNQPAISFAINQRMFVKISQIDGEDVFIKSKFGHLALKNSIQEKKIPNWCKTIYFLLTEIKHRGLDIEIKSQIQDYGFGSSGALFSCICCGLLLLNNKKLSKKKLLKKTLDLYFKYHKNNIFKSSGIDITTSILGGTLYYFPSKNIITNLQHNWLQDYKIYAIYTGYKTSTEKTIKIANKTLKKSVIYKNIGAIVNEIYILLKKIDLDEKKFFDYLTDNQLLLEQLKLSNKDIKNIINQCKQQNICAKISGSGLGDCVIAFCKKNSDFVIKDYKKSEINIDKDGLKYDFE